MKCFISILALCIWMVFVSCSATEGQSYIGRYEVHCVKSIQARNEVKVVALKVVQALGLKFDEIIDDSYSLNMIVRQTVPKNGSYQPGLVFSYAQVPGNSWGITIAKDGPNEDETIKKIRKQIEAVLNDVAPSKWTYSVTSWSYAKP